jgi:NAD(P)-dependent dehydrogenase (short-subunit alcohol dehydrogenase family)
MANRVALITGVGPGTGSALVRRFAAGGFSVAMLARTKARLDALAGEIPAARGYVCDVSDPHQLEKALADARSDLGAPEVLIHNAVGGTFGTFQEIKPEHLLRNFQINAMALLHLARHAAPAMIEAGRGTIIATGNTSALRGKKNFAGFAPSKAAARILLESIARDVGPKGIHVAYLLIDAVIDQEWTRKMKPDAPDEFFIAPTAIAEEAWHIVHQDRSAWSFNVEVRPFGETW